MFEDLLQEWKTYEGKLSALYAEWPGQTATQEQRDDFESVRRDLESRSSSIHDAIYARWEDAVTKHNEAAEWHTNHTSNVGHGNRFSDRRTWELECESVRERSAELNAQAASLNAQLKTLQEAGLSAYGMTTANTAPAIPADLDWRDINTWNEAGQRWVGGRPHSDNGGWQDDD